MAITITAYANSDRTLIVWRTDARIDGCLGFAIERERSGVITVLRTSVGFSGEKEGTAAARVQDSTVWPIQKFMWADYGAHLGDTLKYRVIPMVGTADALTRDDGGASDWSGDVVMTADAAPGFQAYFNRGVVASQWLARYLADNGGMSEDNLKAVISKSGDGGRNGLSGQLRVAMLDLLAEAKTSGVKVFAALYELNDPELVAALKALAGQVEVLLGNGSYSTDDPDPQQAAGEDLAGAGVTVHRRVLTGGPFAHNKYLIVCGQSGIPARVWTGSTNWTVNGLCTQSNNGLLIESLPLAERYKTYWDALVAAQNETPAGLPGANLSGSTTIHDKDVSAWLAPVGDLVDLEEAQGLIDHATQGILFLMFNPGPFGTLFGSIIQRTATASPTYDPNLYVHGVMNQDPGGSKHPEIPPLVFVHRGEAQPAPVSTILPRHIPKAFAYWLKEAYLNNIMVHSKTIVLDPFGEHPVVMTGSHNMGPKASGKNDDNLLIVKGSAGLAQAYAVYVIGIYNDYRWRYYMSQEPAAPAEPAQAPGAPPLSPCDPTLQWAGLIRDDCWQDGYLNDPAKGRELRFWFGEG